MSFCGPAAPLTFPHEGAGFWETGRTAPPSLPPRTSQASWAWTPGVLTGARCPQTFLCISGFHFETFQTQDVGSAGKRLGGDQLKGALTSCFCSESYIFVVTDDPLGPPLLGDCPLGRESLSLWHLSHPCFL